MRPTHPASCAGDFYVEKDCCLSCGVPMVEAPGIFDWAPAPDDNQCIVVRQPETDAERSSALSAMWAAEFSCIRYRGSDDNILRRLVAIGLGDLCDGPLPHDAQRITRSHANFKTTNLPEAGDAVRVAERFREHFLRKGQISPLFKYFSKPIRAVGHDVIVSISWSGQVYHTIVFQQIADREWLAIATANPVHGGAAIGLARLLEGWLLSNAEVFDIRWFSEHQWENKQIWHGTVI